MSRLLAAGAAALTVALGATLAPSAASAAVSLAAGEEGCNVFSAQGCLFDWSGAGGGGGDFDDPGLIVAAYNAVHNATPAPEDLPTLSFLGKSEDGGSGTSWTFADLPFEVSFYVVKSSTQFILFGLDSPTDSFTATNTRITNGGGKAQGISHVTFFGAPSTPPGAVPEPAAWALMIIGFGAAGASLRASRRLKAVA